jgi:hypothetical protein
MKNATCLWRIVGKYMPAQDGQMILRKSKNNTGTNARLAVQKKAGSIFLEKA